MFVKKKKKRERERERERESKRNKQNVIIYGQRKLGKSKWRGISLMHSSILISRFLLLCPFQ